MMRAVRAEAAHDQEADGLGWRSFFHVIQFDTATEDDFLSNEAKGRIPRRPLSPEEQELWRGVSAYESWALARRKAGISPWLGSYIAELRIPPGSSIRARRTTRSRGHW